MLSFLREQETRDSQVQGTDKPAKAGPSPELQQQEYITVSAQNNNVRKSTMLLAVLFVMGLLCLWFMIKKSAPQTASASATGTEETQIERAIAQLTGIKSEMFSRMDEIVKKFYEFSNVLQVQVNELVKNPFELELFLAKLKGKTIAQENFNIDTEMLRKQQLKQQAKNLQLGSIMQSEQGNCCMINDKILYKGDSINGLQVTQIDNNSVKLESQGVEIVLKLSE